MIGGEQNPQFRSVCSVFHHETEQKIFQFLGHAWTRVDVLFTPLRLSCPVTASVPQCLTFHTETAMLNWCPLL